MWNSKEPYTPRGLARLGGKVHVICTAARCTHEATIGPKELIERGYGDIHLNTIARNLRCTRCGAGKPTVGFPLW